MKRLIYIDTSEFVSANFAFTGPRFRTVVSRVEAGQIAIGLPTITKQEIISHIDEALHEADQAIAKARTEARILRNLNDALSTSLFQEFKRDTLRGQLIAQLDAFLSAAEVININFDGVDPAAVFDMYFSKKAPFGDGKKKAEFPDAFSLSMIAAWAEEKQQDVLVASSDSDVKAGVGNFARLQHVGTLEKLLAHIAREFDQLAPAAEIALQALKNDITEDLGKNFQELGFVLDDQQGDVIDTRFSTASFEASLLHVEDIGDDHGQAVFDLVGEIYFEADLSYDDMDTATYDHEDKRYYVFKTIDETVEWGADFQATVTITFSLSGPNNYKYEVAWNSPRDVNVSSNAPFSSWPYK